MNELQQVLNGDDFLRTFQRLATQLRWSDWSREDMAAYYDALKDLTLHVVHESARRLAIEPGRRFFPTTGEWRETALTYEQELRRADAQSPRVWHDECSDCRDTGWTEHECTGSTDGKDSDCGRHTVHAKHSYVRVCPCRAANRTYQRNHQPREFVKPTK